MTSINGDPDGGDMAAASEAGGVWLVRVVWTTTRGETYTEGALHHFHAEPRTGDVYLITEEAIERRDLARGRHSLLSFNTEAGFPVAINPDMIADLTVEVTDPQNNPVTSLEGGYLDPVD